MFFHDRKASDQSIYYLVDGKPFWSKTQAFKECNNDHSKLSLYFMDECWNNKTLAEPVETFKSLCVKRARQLRQKYDALSVFFSGGYDSMTTLYAFIDAKCVIDELIIINKTKFLYDPEFENACRLAHSYKKFVNTKCMITIKDYDHKFYEEFYLKHKQDWIDNSIWSQRFTKSGAEETIMYMPDKSSFEKFGTHNHNYVVSRDNAYVDLRDGKWYMWGIDGHLYHGVGNGVELFYYSHDLPELHLKQTYNVIKWMEQIPHINHELVHKIQSNDTKWYKGYKLGMGRVLPLIDYSIHGWAKGLFTQSTSSPDSKKILDYFKNENKKIYNYYIEGIKKIRYEQFKGLDIEKSIDKNLPITTSQQWYIKDFINKNTTPQSSDVGKKQDA